MATANSPVNYTSYLQLDKLLDAQHLRSAVRDDPAHDEMLFIIVHQAYELWFKQILHELRSVIDMFSKDYVDEREINVSVARLTRITEIQKILIDQLRILETMTPLDFLDFRDDLVPASGFQSVQFRLVENLLGMSPAMRKRYGGTAYYQRVPESQQRIILASENAPSLFQVVDNWLQRTPFLHFQDFSFWQAYRDAVNQMLAEDRKTISENPTLNSEQKSRQLEALETTSEEFAAVYDEQRHDALVSQGLRRFSFKAMHATLLIHLYRDEAILQLPYRLLTVLTDIDELFTTWRYRHALMVHRMIGAKIGTGGSSGHKYLKQSADTHRVFTDLFNISTYLIPRSKLPDLPPTLKQNLGFHFSAEKGAP